MPAKNIRDNTLHFDIHASIVFQLGESLISDEEQAIVELVKNSFDADATYANITIDTNNGGSIVIEDNGLGMDLDAIQRGWLTISNSLKRAFKNENKVTPKGRTPLGDKGLGRLSVQRLGNNVEIHTRPENTNVEYRVSFSWNDFRNTDVLTKVPVKYEELTSNIRGKGTKLIISDLKNIDKWRGDAVQKLTTNLSQLISPYKEARDFIIAMKVDEQEQALAEITDNIRQSAKLHYRIEFDGNTFKIYGKSKLDYFKPEKPEEDEDRKYFKLLVERDAGEDFFNYILEQPASQKYMIAKPNGGDWFIEFKSQCNFTDFDKLQFINGELANPGPFNGEIDAFSLGAGSTSEQNVFDKASEYRKYIKDLSGIKVYRNGFGIRVEHDWLKLGQQQTGGKSYYGLRPQNTIGFIALSAKHNAVLQEKTDREGFMVNPYYSNFFRIMQYFVEYTGNVQQFIRRSWNGYKKEHIEKVAKFEKGVSAKEVSTKIKTNLSMAANYKAPLGKLKEKLSQTITDTHSLISQDSKGFLSDAEKKSAIKKNTDSLKETMDEASQLIGEIEGFLQNIANLESASELLTTQLDIYKDQLEQVYEEVSLGLTAEALSHEIHNIADRLVERTNNLRKYLSQQNITDSNIISYTEHVKSSIGALRKQLSHLAPSLKYVRNVREVIDLNAFFEDMVSYYRSLYEDKEIDFILCPSPNRNFKISINKGKLIQMVDNLFLNSVYWLNEDRRIKYLSKGIVSIEVEKPFIRIYDNGRGILPAYEESIFEPFISAKERGRGLGLFVVTQLLDSEDCEISLMLKRNGFDRRYIFELDLTGALNEQS